MGPKRADRPTADLAPTPDREEAAHSRADRRDVETVTYLFLRLRQATRRIDRLRAVVNAAREGRQEELEAALRRLAPGDLKDARPRGLSRVAGVASPKRN